ncbi:MULTISPECIES: DUF2630 family protein [Streptomyces]|uniref:DUF2630 family protein n=1 Tax=Streptomyces cinereoruber TaxID=67260 RepID=A0AAV4KJP2_9ACTN|nr:MULTISPECIES: DUF2630 family protein [Streptomyces]AVH96610.1 DUF2630 domain-containing protein [Streptomyces sp. WAC00288]KYG55248.1 hypothetical protein AWI43_13020 [Streptomyces sp. WAC04657]MBB4159877.1 hypothetical protein [Streptomyces cinereoruber]MBY8817756.1 DUF2630 family protein [Streptomyces cinereoruber]NIH60585.1 hypothetical protein [Streptomyces cinereoruber]
MDNEEILDDIGALVEEERSLRQRTGGLLPEERARLAALEVRLDQCWDLLRQRRAKEEFGEDPDTATLRPAAEVESYRN